MGYLDNKGLERYTWNVRNKMAQNVQMTKAAPIVQFCPASEIDLEPIVNFKFTETLPAEGTKGPNNPSIITGVDSIRLNHTGKNLLFVNDVVCFPDRGITHQINEDGSVSISGTTVGNGILQFRPGGTTTANTLENSPFIPGMTYTVSLECPDSNVYGYVHYSIDGGSNWLGAVTAFKGGQTRTFTIPENATSLQIWTQVTDGITVNTTVKMQCELGSTTSSFEKGNRESVSIDFDNTYYGGYVNVTTGIMTVTHASIRVGDWQQNITYLTEGGRWQFIASPGAKYTVEPICTHAIFKQGQTFDDATDGLFRWAAGGTNKTWWWFKSPAETVEEFLEIYADARIVFALATPFEVQLDPIQLVSLPSPDKYNPTINTVYTDQESIQVGWIREDFIHKSGDETITGVKTFKNTASGHSVGETVTDLIVRNEAVQRGVGGEGRSYTRVIFADADGDIEETYAGRLGFWECVTPKENDTIGSYIQMGSYKYSQETTDLPKHVDLRVGWDADEVQFATAPETSDKRNNPADVVTRGWAESKTWNWQKTNKESIVQFNSVPNSILEPVVEFKFKETLPESGEKGPENPSTIEGISSINVGRAGKNLILGGPFPLALANITYVVNADGSITFNGSSTPSGDHSYIYTFNQTLNRYSFPSFMKRGGTYRLSATCSKSINYILYQVYVSINGAVWNNPLCEVYGGQSKTFTIPENATGLACRYIIVSGKTVDNATFKAQLEYSSSETEYEKPIVDNYVIQLGSTYYGGKIDLATGIMTVTWIEKILDRSSLVAAAGFTWNSPNKTSKRLFFRLNGSATGFPEIKNADNVICSHFRRFDSNTLQEQSDLIFGTFNCQNDSDKWCMFYDNDMVVCDDTKTVYENKELFVDWFEAKKQGGDPVYLVYELKEPQTIQLTPTQIFSLTQTDKYTPRLNTFYTDVASVQVGYQRYVNEDNFVDKESRIPEEEIDEAFAE